MNGQELALRPTAQLPSTTFRDVVVMTFRHRRAVATCFGGILLGALAAALLWPRYRSETEVLVRRERIDAVVSPQQNAPIVLNSLVTEDEMNSEVELIKSNDVLRQVVIATGLDRKKNVLDRWFGTNADTDKRIDSAVHGLESHLTIEALPKTNIIKIGYLASDAHFASLVLSTLDQKYIEKHKAMHNAGGQLQFFDAQTQKARQQLDNAEQRLKAFPAANSVANPVLARDTGIQKLNEFNASLGQTRASIADTQKRIAMLKQLSQATPKRITTQVRHEDDAPVLQQLKATLLQLQLKRVALGAKYQPDYPPLVELDREIAETQRSISAEQPLRDESTDQNPTYTWVDSELAKAQAELHGLQARANATEALIRKTIGDVNQLDREGIEQQDLLRDARASEENYLLYLRKTEEARISDALDQNQILNVAIAEKPTVPSSPAQSPLLFGLLGLVLATAVSAGVVVSMEYLDPSFRTSAEIERLLNVPVLAAVPHDLPKLNGNHSGRSMSIIEGTTNHSAGHDEGSTF